MTRVSLRKTKLVLGQKAAALLIGAVTFASACSTPRPTDKGSPDSPATQSQASPMTAPGSSPKVFTESDRAHTPTGSCSVLGRVVARRLSDAEYEMHRGDYVASLEHLVAALTPRAESERVVPGKNAEGELGFHLFGIRDEASCGLHNGDLVLRVNGHNTADGANFPATMKDWQNQPEVVVDLERRSAGGWIAKTVRYRVVD
jgi:hypothetical protein